MKRSAIVAASLAAVVIVLALAVKFVAPGILKTKILDGVRESCPDCVVYFKSVDISLTHPGLLTFTDVRFAAGEGGHSMIEVRLAALEADIALTKSSKEKVTFTRVEGDGAEFIYSDGDAPARPEQKKEESKQLQFEVEQTKLHGALFRYVHTKRKKSSILHISNIDGELSAVGNTPEVLEKMATAKLTGLIEKSGEGTLTLAALTRPGPWYVDVLLELKGMNLEDLNTFFTPNDGVELKGKMIKAVAKINARGDASKAHVEAIYENADYKESATKDRSGIEAALSNIGSAIMMTKTNVSQAPEKQMADTDVKRDEGEPLVHFLLKSAKLGLLDVVKKK